MNPYAGLAIGVLILLFSSGVSIMSQYPTYDDLFKKYAPSGIDWMILKRIAWVESRVGTDPSVKRGLANPSDVSGSQSSDGLSWGIMQMTVGTARDFDPSATAEKLNNPEYSIRLAGLYIDWCKNYLLRNTSLTQNDPRFLEFLVKSYNEGVGRAVQEIRYGSVSAADDYWQKFNDAEV